MTVLKCHHLNKDIYKQLREQIHNYDYDEQWKNMLCQRILY